MKDSDIVCDILSHIQNLEAEDAKEFVRLYILSLENATNSEIDSEALLLEICDVDKRFDEYITAAEAAEIWGLGESTLRVAFNKKDERFEKDDYRKSGKVWLVKKSAIYRVYGEPKKRGWLPR